MSSTAQFRVRIYGLSGTGLQLPSGESNIQLKVNFDGYKEFTTEARTLDANPSWSDDVEFQYHTRHARSLSQKRLRFTLQSTSSGFFRTSTRDWGEAVVDLHTLATGPVDHKNIRILDGSSPRGSLNFSVVMEQAITATVNFADVAITGNHAASQGQVMLQFAYTGHEKYTEKTVCTEAGGPRFAFLPQLRLSTVFSTFTSSSISFWLRGVTGSSSMGDVLASASLQTSNTPIFTDGKPSSFALTLHTPTGQAAGQMTGRMWYTQTPDYLQMAGGYHTEAGIYGASFVIPNLPDKPKCYVQGAASAPASQGRGHLAGLGAALVGARPQQPSPGARGGLSTGHLGAQIAVRALGRKLGGDSPAPGSTVVLPHAWDRRVDPKSGRAYFFNTATSTSTWQLPTQSTFEVSFMHAGPLGLELVRNWSGRRESGKPSGRRYSGQDRGAVVRSVAPGSQAAHVTTPQRIQPGMHLICINRGTTLQWDLATTLGVLRRTPRPVMLTFHNPYAVPPAVARAALDLDLAVEAGDTPEVRPPSRQAAAAATTVPPPRRRGAGSAGSGAGYGYGGGAAAAPAPAPAAAAAGSDDGWGSASEPDQSQMWVEMKDHISGKLFWLNNATGEVTFSRPDGL